MGMTPKAFIIPALAKDGYGNDIHVLFRAGDWVVGYPEGSLDTDYPFVRRLKDAFSIPITPHFQDWNWISYVGSKEGVSLRDFSAAYNAAIQIYFLGVTPA